MSREDSLEFPKEPRPLTTVGADIEIPLCPSDGDVHEPSLVIVVVVVGKPAGIEGRASGHSLQVKGASFLAAAGAWAVAIQTVAEGNPASLLGRYARDHLAAHGAMAMLCKGAWGVIDALLRLNLGKALGNGRDQCRHCVSPQSSGEPTFEGWEL